MTNLEFDVTEQIKGPGLYLVKFVQTKGDHGLYLHAAELLGSAGASDRHEGFAGSSPTNETFTLRVPTNPASPNFRLRLTLEPAGGTDTWGKMYLVPLLSR